MTNSFHGYIIQANVPLDEPALEKHLRILRPELIHVLNNPSYAAHLKRNVIPDSKVYLRHYDADGDGNDWVQYSPQSYFDKYAGETMGGALGLQICNEPGFGRDVTQRLVGFMAEAVKRNIPTDPGGFSVGTPPAAAAAWSEHDDFLHIICQHPDLLSYSAHEYFEVLPGSGMVTSQTKPGEFLYFATHFLKMSDWPKAISVLSNMFHVGRIKAAVDYAAGKGYGKLPIHITEHGCDDVEGTLKPWKLSLRKGAEIRGYKPCDDQWFEWYSLPRAEVYMAMLEWIHQTIYKPLGVKGALLYTWGNSGKAGTAEDWQTFDIATDPDFQKQIETYAVSQLAHDTTPVPPPIPVPVPTPPPPIPLPTQEHVDLIRVLQIEREKALLQAQIAALDTQIALIMGRYIPAA